MNENYRIDFAKLFGFETVSDHVSDGVDFQDETVGAKLGAKIGEPSAPADSIDHSQLLGFETVCGRLAKGVDFQDETVGAKLGAKVGEVTGADSRDETVSHSQDSGRK